MNELIISPSGYLVQMSGRVQHPPSLLPALRCTSCWACTPPDLPSVEGGHCDLGKAGVLPAPRPSQDPAPWCSPRAPESSTNTRDLVTAGCLVLEGGKGPALTPWAKHRVRLLTGVWAERAQARNSPPGHIAGSFPRENIHANEPRGLGSTWVSLQKNLTGKLELRERKEMVREGPGSSCRALRARRELWLMETRILSRPPCLYLSPRSPPT